MATSCAGCHGGAEAATVTARFEPEQLEPGGTGTLVVEVTANGSSEAGIAIFGPIGGTFAVPQGEPLTVSGEWVLHNQPKAASGGTVEFRVEWTAPNETGVALFEIAALAADGNNGASGDKPGGTNFKLGHGCAPTTVYFDSDGDGYGREDSWIAACGPDENYVEVFGDCADSDPARNPEADEVCNGKDDDCDGEVDEGVELGMFYEDVDGDGFGDPASGTETCTPEAGYVPNGDDCDDRSATNNPDAEEICDYVDNNCDGDVDEELRPTCGLGLCKRVSDLCDSTALCSPGQPFTETCNSLDDDCDGEIDEEGCPPGQGCFENACMDLGTIPNNPAPAPTPSSSSPADSSSTWVSALGSDSGEVSSVPGTGPAEGLSSDAPGVQTPAPSAPVGDGPKNTGCSTAPSGSRGSFGLFGIAVVFGYLKRRRKT